MHLVSRRNIIKSLLLAPVAGYVPVFGANFDEDSSKNYVPGYVKLCKSGEQKNGQIYFGI